MMENVEELRFEALVHLFSVVWRSNCLLIPVSTFVWSLQIHLYSKHSRCARDFDRPVCRIITSRSSRSWPSWWKWPASSLLSGLDLMSCLCWPNLLASDQPVSPMFIFPDPGYRYRRVFSRYMVPATFSTCDFFQLWSNFSQYFPSKSIGLNWNHDVRSNIKVVVHFYFPLKLKPAPEKC